MLPFLPAAILRVRCSTEADSHTVITHTSTGKFANSRTYRVTNSQTLLFTLTQKLTLGLIEERLAKSIFFYSESACMLPPTTWLQSSTVIWVRPNDEYVFWKILFQSSPVLFSVKSCCLHIGTLLTTWFYREQDSVALLTHPIDGFKPDFLNSDYSQHQWHHWNWEENLRLEFQWK